MRTGRATVDRVGAGLSALCAVHCVLAGVAASALPLLGLGFLHSPALERFFLVGAIALGGVSLTVGVRRHRCARPAIALGAGMALLLLGHEAFGHGVLGALVSAGGGLFMVAFHVMNARHLARCACG